MAINSFPFLDDERKKAGVVPPATTAPNRNITQTATAPAGSVRQFVPPQATPTVRASRFGPNDFTNLTPGVPAPSRRLSGSSGGPVAEQRPGFLQQIGQNARKFVDQNAAASAQVGRELRSVGNAIGNAAQDVKYGFTGQPDVQFIDPRKPATAAAPAARGRPSAQAAAPATGAPAGGDALDLGTYRTTAAGAQPVNVPTATSISGRNLGYGQIVNGVRTFSDGSGAGGIPRTMSDQQIGDLGSRVNVADAGALSRPGIGTVVSDITGGAATPDVGGIRRNLPDASSQLAASAASQAAQNDRFRQSDINSIITADPRSALGAAARKLQMDAQYGDRLDKRQAAQAGIAALVQNAAGQGQNGFNLASELAQGAQREAGANFRNLSDNQTRLAEANINRPRPQLLQQADGSYVAVDDTGTVARPLIGAGGAPVRGMTPKSEGAITPKDRLNAYIEESKGLNSILDDKQRAAAETALRDRYADVLGSGSQAAAAPAGSKPSLEKFLERARAANPGVSDAELSDYYKKTYGA